MTTTKSSCTTMLSRRTFLATSAVTLSPVLLNCKQAPALANAAGADPNPVTTYAADFRRNGLSDRDILREAFAAWLERGGVLHLEHDRVYDLGEHADESNVFALAGQRNSVLAGNGATIVIRTTGNQKYNLFYLQHYRGLRIENLTAVDLGFADDARSGAMFIVVDAASEDSVDLTLENVAGERLVSFIQLQGKPGGPRVRGVRIVPSCYARRVFYALACMDQGDDVSGGFSTYNCARSYFPYGVSGHDLALRIFHEGALAGPEAETPILIKSYQRPTSDIRVRVLFSGSLSWARTLVSIEHQHEPSEPSSLIQNIYVRLNVAPGTRDPNQVHRVILRSYRRNGTEEVGLTSNIWRGILLDGDLRSGARPAIYSRVRPEHPYEIEIAQDARGAGPSDIDAPGFRFQRRMGFSPPRSLSPDMAQPHPV